MLEVVSGQCRSNRYCPWCGDGIKGCVCVDTEREEGEEREMCEGVNTQCVYVCCLWKQCQDDWQPANPSAWELWSKIGFANPFFVGCETPCRTDIQTVRTRIPIQNMECNKRERVCGMEIPHSCIFHV